MIPWTRLPERDWNLNRGGWRWRGALGELDDYLTQRVTPNLWPGEQVFGYGCLQVNLGTDHKHRRRWAYWLAVGTSKRLVLFRASPGFFGPKPDPNGKCRSYHYDELARVETGTPRMGLLTNPLGSSHTVIALTPHPGGGPEWEEDPVNQSVPYEKTAVIEDCYHYASAGS